MGCRLRAWIGAAHEPLSIPAWVWQRDELRAVLRCRDIGGLFRLVQRYGGVSQSRLAVATGLLQGRISKSSREPAW